MTAIPPIVPAFQAPLLAVLGVPVQLPPPGPLPASVGAGIGTMTAPPPPPPVSFVFAALLVQPSVAVRVAQALLPSPALGTLSRTAPVSLVPGARVPSPYEAARGRSAVAAPLHRLRTWVGSIVAPVAGSSIVAVAMHEYRRRRNS